MQYLYKYRPDDIYTIKLLCEQRLHFSHPFDFNDPFDCKPLCAKEISAEDIISTFERECPWHVELLKSCIDDVLKLVPLQSEETQKNFNITFNRRYICCFSFKADIPAMWAHYSQDHHGLCLGFDTSIKSPFLEGHCGKIRYSDKQSIFNWAKLGTKEDNSDNILFEKSKDWEYEQEYRVIKHKIYVDQAQDTYNSFKKEALVAMYFGLRMPQERQDFYRLLCKQCGLNNVKFFKMTMPTDGTYHLIPQEIN